MIEKPKTLDRFGGGLVINGGRDDMPPGTLRRNNGAYVLREVSQRSRYGSIQLFAPGSFTGTVTSLFKFGGLRFQGDNAGKFYRNGTPVKTGLNGNQLTFAKMPPSVGQSDYLFVGNGGSAFKIDPTVGAATNWGIVAPTTSPTLALGVVAGKVIQNLDGDSANWSFLSAPFNPDSATLSDDSNFHQAGTTKSLKVTFPSLAAGTPAFTTIINRTLAIDLTSFTGGAASVNQDLITLFIGVDRADLVSSVEIAFNLTANRSDYYSYKVNLQPTSFISTDLQNQQQGINTALGGTGASNIEPTFVSAGQVPGIGSVQDPSVRRQVLSSIHRSNMPSSANSWFQLAVSKDEFNRTGTSNLNWSNVMSVDIKMVTAAVPTGAPSTGVFNIFFNLLNMAGGTGMEGNYSYAVVFANTTTGSISNPSPMTNGLFPTIKGVMRQPVALSAIPVSTDSQVNARLLYRTLGNGALLFFLDIINDNTTTTYTDTVADFTGFNGGSETKVLGQTITWPIQLQTDNAPPPSPPTFIAGPYAGSMFWLDAAHPGRLNYSPTGRPESTENFLDVTNTDDKLQNLVIWNNNLYLLSQKGLFIIQQVSTSPLLFVANRIMGAPGTSFPFSVVPGKLYLFYQAGEGWMGFNGFVAQPFGMQWVGEIWRGDGKENLLGMSVQTAAYVNGEVIMSDTLHQTLAVNEGDQTWRNLSVVYSALYFEEDIKLYSAVLNGAVVLCEQPAVFTDNGTAIAIDWMTPTTMLAEDMDVTLLRVVIDINTKGQTVTPKLILNDADVLNVWVSQSYIVGEQIQDSNGNIQQCIVGGASGAVQPVWSQALNATTVDNAVTWQLVGPGIVTLPAAVSLYRQQLEYNVALKCHTVNLELTASLSTGFIELYHIQFNASVGA